MIIKMATGKDFDRLNNMSAYSRLQDLVELASGSGRESLSPVQRYMAINSRSYFIMEVW